jgi:hypothetical protein
VLQRAARGIEHEQAGAVARCGGMRGDALRGELEVE